jgi:hypothetical protein
MWHNVRKLFMIFGALFPALFAVIFIRTWYEDIENIVRPYYNLHFGLLSLVMVGGLSGSIVGATIGMAILGWVDFYRGTKPTWQASEYPPVRSRLKEKWGWGKNWEIGDLRPVDNEKARLIEAGLDGQLLEPVENWRDPSYRLSNHEVGATLRIMSLIIVSGIVVCCLRIFVLHR